MRLLLTAASIACFFLPCLASGQVSGSPRGSACVDSLDPSTFHRVPVFLNASVPDKRWVPLLPGADLLTQAVALRVREILDPAASGLPAADSVVNWRNLWGTVVVAVARNGQFNARPHSFSLAAMNDPRSALVLAMRAINDVAATGELVMWPEGLAGDSAYFTILIERPLADKSGSVRAIALRQPAPMFTIRTPWETPVDVKRQPRIVYPELTRTNSVYGTVRFAFTVTETGKADISSLEEVLEEGAIRPTGDRLEYYSAFLAAVKRGLPSAEYRPAVIGGCPVRQRVIESFEFKLDWSSR